MLVLEQNFLHGFQSLLILKNLLHLSFTFFNLLLALQEHDGGGGKYIANYSSSYCTNINTFTFSSSSCSCLRSFSAITAQSCFLVKPRPCTVVGRQVLFFYFFLRTPPSLISLRLGRCPGMHLTPPAGSARPAPVQSLVHLCQRSQA